jgi:hypothetical protein
MLTGDITDTFSNLLTFAFIAAMIWLVVRDLPPRSGEMKNGEGGASDREN